MKTVPPGWRPDAGADPEALIKEARRRQHRRYLTAGLAIVVILAAAAGVTLSLTRPGGHSPSRRGSAHQSTSVPSQVSAPSALPRFFADDVTTSEGSGPLEIRSAADGRLVAQLEHTAGVDGLAAAGADSYVIALQAGQACATRLYRVQLSGQGRPGELAPVGPELPGLVWSLTTGAGGGVVGYAISGCAKGDRGYIGVFDTRTGRSRQWGDVSLGGVSPGSVAMSGTLSMSANGRWLAFTGWNVGSNGRVMTQVVRVLSTAAPAGAVAERSHVVLSRPASAPELATASLSPGGSSFYLCTQTGSRTGHVTNVARYQTSTGKLLENLASLAAAPTQMWCSMALDTSGQFLLVPYSLSPSPAGTPVLKVARINTATRAVTPLTIQLPRTAGMDPETGMNAAW